MILHIDIDNWNGTIYTQSVYQYDKNVKIQFTGENIPESYHAYFSNSKDRGFGVACTSKKDENDESIKYVIVPNALLLSGDYIYAWLSDADKTGIGTFGQITIPVIPRPIPVSKVASDESGGYHIDYEIDEEDENFIIKQTGV